MSSTSLRAERASPLPPQVQGHRPRDLFAVRFVCLYVWLLLVVPSNTTLAVVGAAGFPAALLGLGATGLYAWWTLTGAHNPLLARYPTKVVLPALWLSTLLSYVAFQSRTSSAIEVNGADRWLLFLASVSGVYLLAAECIGSLPSLLRVLRAMVWAGAACGVVAALQFWLEFDLSPTIGGLFPGFSYDETIGGIQQRAALNRVPGTTLNPIELGAVTSVLLPIAIALVVIDRGRSGWRRFAPLAVLAACIPFSVSRSAIISVAVALLVFAPQVRAVLRLWIFACVPVAFVAVFATMPGFFSTLTAFFRGVSTDSSVTTRTDDYAIVAEMFRQRPLLGLGGGTYLPQDLLLVLDNTYLKWVLEFGIIGLLVLLVLVFGLPVVVAVTIRRRTTDPQVALVAAALGGGVASCAVSSATFDLMAFPTSSCLLVLAIGLIGCVWRIGTTPPPSPHLQRGTRVDTLNAWRAIRRNARAVVPVLICAALSLVALVAFFPKTYRVQGAILLVPPPPAPTETDIERDPELGRIPWDNLFTRQYDPTTLISTVSLSVESEAGREAVLARGGAETFELTQQNRYGQPTPIVEVVGWADSPEAALHTTQVVLDVFSEDLKQLQVSSSAFGERYLIRTLTVQQPNIAEATATDSSRAVIAVLAVTVFLLFFVVGLGDALRSRREIAQAPSIGYRND